MSQAAGPLVPRRRLGAELRRLREAAGLQLADVAAELECSTSKVSRLETGKGIPKVRDVRDMLSLYGVAPGERFDRLVTWAREGQQQGWWAEFSDLFQNDPSLPDNFDQYVALEADADAIYAYEPTLVHGLLQTADYAGAVFRAAAFSRGDDETHRLTALRLRRQAVLARPDPLAFHIILSEPAVRRRIGGHEVHRQQLRHLIRTARRPDIDLRVLPLSAGEHPAMAGSYSVLLFDDLPDQNVVYIEFQLGTVYLDGAAQIDRYRSIHQGVRAKALGREDSVTFLREVLSEA